MPDTLFHIHTQRHFSNFGHKKRDEKTYAISHSSLLVEIDGFEPTTPCLQSRCSSQLSYTPKFCVSFWRLPRWASHPSKNKSQNLSFASWISAALGFAKESKNWWEQRESNPRPSACKADALNQLSYAPIKTLRKSVPRSAKLNVSVGPNQTPKRRCSSHTFRYGYLVTT